MNDAERDAWLREALRHAPDSDALPPQGVSEAILAQARAAARGAQALPAKAPGATTNPLLAFWDWLARPPVAAGFASVMAATIVGLMWWDRPMDETLPRRPDVASERATLPAPSVVTVPAESAGPPTRDEAGTSTSVAASPVTTPPAAGEATGALADLAPTRRQESTGRSTTARDGKVAAAPFNEERKRADAKAKENALRTDRMAATPAPFPPLADDRAVLAAKPSAPLAKKDTTALATRPSDATAPAGGAAAGNSVAAEPAAAPATPPAAVTMRAQPAPAQAPLRRRADDDEGRAAASKVERDVAKSAPAAAMPPPPMVAQVPALRSDALGEREKQASAFAPPPTVAAPAPMRSELAAAQREGAVRAAPLAPLLGDIASEPARWARSTAGGNAVPLDGGWRDWLSELDAATAGRWRRVTAAAASADGERDGATTLRLVAAGRPPLVVRLDGTTVHIDGPTPGERWQASVPAAVAERLRSAAGRLPP